MKKNVIMFFPTHAPVSSAYEGLTEAIQNREKQMFSRFPQENVNIYMTRDINNFYWENVFTPDFQLIWEKWEIYSWSKIQWDLVLGFKMPENVTHKYPSNMRDICLDKSLLENIFPDFCITSILCNTYEDIQKNFEKISTSKKVLKPISESGGRWIIISEHLPSSHDLSSNNFPYLLQEFHDTSGGFFDQCEGTHDFRVVILNGEIIWKILRQPSEGSLVCNTWSGWSLKDIWDFQIPENIMKIINTIDSYCAQYNHRYYSIDMWMWPNGNIKVYELNSAAALSSERIAHKLWDYIVKNILKVS